MDAAAASLAPASFSVTVIPPGIAARFADRVVVGCSAASAKR
jgi:hypothetical protein